MSPLKDNHLCNLLTLQTEVKLDCFKTFRGISPPVTLLVGIFLITFSISLTVTGLKENFRLIA